PAPQQVQELLAGQAVGLDVLQGHRGGRPSRSVEERHLAEELPRPQRVHDHLLRVLPRHRQLHPAAPDHEEDASGLVLPEDRGARREAGLLHEGGHRLPFVAVERLEERDAFEHFGSRRHRASLGTADSNMARCGAWWTSGRRWPRTLPPTRERPRTCAGSWTSPPAIPTPSTAASPRGTSRGPRSSSRRRGSACCSSGTGSSSAGCSPEATRTPARRAARRWRCGKPGRKRASPASVSIPRRRAPWTWTCTTFRRGATSRPTCTSTCAT